VLLSAPPQIKHRVHAPPKGLVGWHNGAMSNDDGLDRATSKDFGSLRGALGFLSPYKKQVVIASLALIVTAGVTLSMGQGMRIVIDQGFSEGSSELLAQSLLVFAGLVVLLTIGTFVRFYYVSWVGERVSADIRLAVFNHLIRLHPGFFEQNSPTEIQSRITTDTTLIQSVIGSSASVAQRSLIAAAIESAGGTTGFSAPLGRCAWSAPIGARTVSGFWCGG